MSPAPEDAYVRTPEILALMRRVFRALLIVTAVVGGAGIAFGLLSAGLPGLWAALIAAAAGLFFTAATVGGLYLAAGRGQQLLMIVLLGGWLVKIVILGILMFWLRGQSFYDRTTFVATIITLVLAALIVEMVLTVTARIPYVAVNSVTDDAPRHPATRDDDGHDPRQSAESGTVGAQGAESRENGADEGTAEPLR